MKALASVAILVILCLHVYFFEGNLYVPKNRYIFI